MSIPGNKSHAGSIKKTQVRYLAIHNMHKLQQQQYNVTMISLCMLGLFVDVSSVTVGSIGLILRLLQMTSVLFSVHQFIADMLQVPV